MGTSSLQKNFVLVIKCMSLTINDRACSYFACKNNQHLPVVYNGTFGEYHFWAQCECCLTLVHPTRAVVIFGNIPTAFGTLALAIRCWHPWKILRRSSQGNPSVWGVKHSMGSQI